MKKSENTMKTPPFLSSMKPSTLSPTEKYFAIKLSNNEIFVNKYTPENVAEIRVLLNHQKPLEFEAASIEDAYSEATMLYAYIALGDLK